MNVASKEWQTIMEYNQLMYTSNLVIYQHALYNIKELGFPLLLTKAKGHYDADVNSSKAQFVRLVSRSSIHSFWFTIVQFIVLHHHYIEKSPSSS